MRLLECTLDLLLPRYVVLQSIKAGFPLEFEVFVRQNCHAQALNLEEANPNPPRLEHSFELQAAELKLESDHTLPSLLVLIMDMDPRFKNARHVRSAADMEVTSVVEPDR